MPENGGATDWSDVLIALARQKLVWFTIIFGILVWSGWATPSNVSELVDTGFRAWRCQP